MGNQKTLLNGLECVLMPFFGKHQSIPDYAHSSTSESLCDRKRFHLFFKILSARGLFPIANASERFTVESLLSELRILVGNDLGPTIICSSCGVDFISAIKLVIDKASKAFPGFCLDCVNHGKESGGSSCRTPHEGFLGLKE